MFTYQLLDVEQVQFFLPHLETEKDILEISVLFWKWKKNKSGMQGGCERVFFKAHTRHFSVFAECSTTLWCGSAILHTLKLFNVMLTLSSHISFGENTGYIWWDSHCLETTRLVLAITRWLLQVFNCYFVGRGVVF